MKPQRPVALSTLVEAWNLRDARYRGRGISAEEAASIRAWRAGEISFVPPVTRTAATRALAAWSPPK